LWSGGKNWFRQVTHIWTSDQMESGWTKFPLQLKGICPNTMTASPDSSTTLRLSNTHVKHNIGYNYLIFYFIFNENYWFSIHNFFNNKKLWIELKFLRLMVRKNIICYDMKLSSLIIFKQYYANYGNGLPSTVQQKVY
jgi:hypothetical protein